MIKDRAEYFKHHYVYRIGINDMVLQQRYPTQDPTTYSLDNIIYELWLKVLKLIRQSQTHNNPLDYDPTWLTLSNFYFDLTHSSLIHNITDYSLTYSFRQHDSRLHCLDLYNIDIKPNGSYKSSTRGKTYVEESLF